MKPNTTLRFLCLLVLVLAAGLSRILPHPWNMTPVVAMAMFGGAYFTNRIWAVLIPLVSLWISDLILDNTLYASKAGEFVWFYGGFYWQYGATAVVSVLAMFSLRKVTVPRFLISALSSAVLFFLVSNFGVWIGNKAFTQDFSGLVKCYTDAIPFFKGTLIGDFFYGTILFGGFELATRYVPRLQLARA